MANPPVPTERKRQLGNPSHRPLPEKKDVIELEAGNVEPLRPLGPAGQRLWDDIFRRGELWVSGRTDSQLVQLVCEQIDRREMLRTQLVDCPDQRSLHMSLNDIEKLISSNLGLLGFTPTDRSRIGVAEVRKNSKIDELRRRAEELRQPYRTVSAGSSILKEEKNDI